MDLPPPELTPCLTEAVHDEFRVRQECEKGPHRAVPVLQLFDPSEAAEIPVGAVEVQIPRPCEKGSRDADDAAAHEQPAPIPPAGAKHNSSRDDRRHCDRGTLSQQIQTECHPEYSAKAQGEAVSHAGDETPQNE